MERARLNIYGYGSYLEMQAVDWSAEDEDYLCSNSTTFFKESMAIIHPNKCKEQQLYDSLDEPSPDESISMIEEAPI